LSSFKIGPQRYTMAPERYPMGRLMGRQMQRRMPEHSAALNAGSTLCFMTAASQRILCPGALWLAVWTGSSAARASEMRGITLTSLGRLHVDQMSIASTRRQPMGERTFFRYARYVRLAFTTDKPGVQVASSSRFGSESRTLGQERHALVLEAPLRDLSDDPCRISTMIVCAAHWHYRAYGESC